MELTINGENHTFPEALSISEVMELLGIVPEQVAVERNLKIVPKSLHATTLVEAGDIIEIVEFIGGG
jgi:thiamine biosynthesis protein ThiS